MPFGGARRFAGPHLPLNTASSCCKTLAVPVETKAFPLGGQRHRKTQISARLSPRMTCELLLVELPSCAKELQPSRPCRPPHHCVLIYYGDLESPIFDTIVRSTWANLARSLLTTTHAGTRLKSPLPSSPPLPSSLSLASTFWLFFFPAIPTPVAIQEQTCAVIYTKLADKRSV